MQGSGNGTSNVHLSGRHRGKVGPETRDPPQSLKVGFKNPLKFKSGTPSPFFNRFNFFRIFIRIFYLFVFVSFLNKIQKNINCK